MSSNRARGIRITTDGYGVSVESETFTCPHCNRVRAKPAPGADVGWCQRCFTITCIACHATCTPFEKKLLKFEAVSRLRAVTEADGKILR
jgi:hypothetical protein